MNNKSNKKLFQTALMFALPSSELRAAFAASLGSHSLHEFYLKDKLFQIAPMFLEKNSELRAAFAASLGSLVIGFTFAWSSQTFKPANLQRDGSS